MRKYAIVDIETTGGLYNRDKITEIAIIVTDGQTILEEFTSLINPERSVPAQITRITGIDDALVADAPKFYEVAKEVVEITAKTIFVAHNAKFDYSFIKEEFRRLGYAFNRKTLCTVKLARTFIPGLRSYGLDSLIKEYDIQIKDRHRAYDDAYATYELFLKLISGQPDHFSVDMIVNRGINASVLPAGISIDDMHATPEAPGIYYLSDKQGRILYVGKAKNIKTRLFQHFRNLSRKSINIYNSIYKIHYEETGSELIALLWELHEIKTIQPELNKALRRTNYPYAIYRQTTENADKPSLLVLKNNNKNDLRYEKIKLFGSKLSADSFIQNLVIEQELCVKQVKSRSRNFACFCEGQCAQFFDLESGIEHAVKLAKNEFDHDKVLLINGRNESEQAYIVIDNGTCIGFGFIENTVTINTKEDWMDNLHLTFSFPEANGIIKHHLSKNNLESIPLK